MPCLVVDDDPDIRAFIRAALQWEAFETVEADGGERALAVVEALAGGLDLIITDLQMPGGDGLTFARSVQDRFPSVPIILISGLPNPDAGFEYIGKPFGWTALLSVVRKVVGAIVRPA
jgi:DNA-binding response OmpR family regulator